MMQKEEIREYIADQEGIRLDKILAEKNSDLSRVAIQRMIEEKNIFVNGKIEKSSYKVQIGDKILIKLPQAKEINLKAQDIPIEVVYEDNDIIIVNKPKGLVVHPGNGNPDGTLVNAMMNICKDSLSGIGGEIRPGIVHRLDKDTSGLLIIAKNDIAHIYISEQIKQRKVQKTYIALVRGNVRENERSPKDRKKMAVNKNGKEAITHFKVLERFERLYLTRSKN